ncbi:hypothetical protein QOZ88_05920 [Blastococcus sp. BMG 814]|uniref:Uncharacterized protein n=1 Tax=Blastococcus carthaginiensis TaxID=3050034 RepID=A0ABT9I9C1_9ACTN|nr:hypothetical protein [Blastococcus carthaginiensis]MDP5182167.1 hypothetical protein [Blastococcus carthaginiensis]
MPRTLINPQPVDAAGVKPAYTAADGVNGNSFRLASGTALHVKNGSAAAVTATIPTAMTVDGLAVADRAVSIPAGEDRLIALGTNAAYVQPGGVAHLDLSATASVTVAVLTIP